ncbi:MAG: DNA polymerase III subunit gamma/tau [Chlamydiae bacterium]|nr:DNA polymerase III subunit gamma/tau [Chlamydiota bacterium]MBI3266637.1 DNA polymerase III subunit gamma/tau [Chlamydiota bacterium]
MSYLVLARKWRPQQFEEVVGQNHVMTTLRNAIAMGRVAHAYLFSGPRGVGKTTTARLLAKALNCKKGPTADPCDKCVNCQEISAGTSLDVLEIDGASNRGIDQIRELRDNVKFSPASSPFKIYIIDEVHMLTQEAFNALLKTLEEPPAHVKFFFATTEAHRVPTTILSRCQHFGLRKISTQEIFDCLKGIVKKEKWKADDPTLFAVAKVADGSLRDAQSLLDQLVSFSGGTLKYEEALQILGCISRDEVMVFFQALREGNWKGLFSAIQKMDREGKDLTLFVSELATHFRDLLMLQLDDQGSDLIELASEDIQKLKNQISFFARDLLLQMLDVTLEAEDRLKFSLSKRMTLEALAVRLYLTSRAVSLEHLIEKVGSLEKGALEPIKEVTRDGGKKNGSVSQAEEYLSYHEAKKSTDPSSPKSLTPKGATIVVGDPLISSTKTLDSRLPLSGATSLKPAGMTDRGERSEFNPELWKKFLENAFQHKPLLHAYLKEAFPSFEMNQVRLSFSPSKSFCLESLKNENHFKWIQDELRRLGGKEISLELVEADSLVEGESSAPGSFSNIASAIQDDPVIQKALAMFEGKITDIKR